MPAMFPVLIVAAVASPAPLDEVVFVQQGSSACAGAFIDDQGTVATAYHCVAAGGRPRVMTRDGRRTTGRVVGVDRAHDLALIATPSFAGEPFLARRDTPPEPGSTVRALGHPYGALPPVGFLEGMLRWSVSEGIVSAVGRRAIQFTAPINPGNSGGPVVDEDGALIGVVSRRLNGDGLGFAGRADVLGELTASETRGMGPLGGRISTEIFVQTNSPSALPISVGARARMAFRDRVVLDIAGSTPVGARWQALQLGRADHAPLELRGALRQRFGRGPWTARLDAYGGMVVIESLTSDRVRLDIDRSVSTAPLVGGRIGVRNVALDYGVALSEEPFIRMQAVLTWPGLLGVF